MATCSRWRASRASIRPCSRAGITAANTRPAERHRQAAVQPRAARHLSVRLDHQAADRAGRADLSRGRPQPTGYCAGVFHLPGSATCSANSRTARTANVDLDARDRQVLRRVLLRAGASSASTASHFHGAVRLRGAHRHRHQRREAGPAALARVEEESLQATGRIRSGSRARRSTSGSARATCW